MVTNIVFDWRGYDTLGEALILVSAVIVTLLVFGRGRVKLGGKLE
jgi:energy-converting hydrogenase B subunit H